MVEETNFPRHIRAAQIQYTLIVIRCSPSPGYHGLIAGYDIDVISQRYHRKLRGHSLASSYASMDRQPYLLYCNHSVSTITAFRPHRLFGAVWVARSLSTVVGSILGSPAS